MRYFIYTLFTLVALLGCKHAEKEKTKETDTYYTCSMDPQVVADKPGKCPICKMELTLVKKNASAAVDELQLNEQQIQLGNIRTETIHNGKIADQVVLTATLNFDQMQANSLSARVSGRVEKLYFKNMGDYITAGALVYEIYSEELNNAKQEFLNALEKKNRFNSEQLIDMNAVYQSAKNKLLLLGLQSFQIDELIKTKQNTKLTKFYSHSSGYLTQLDIREGEYVMEGGTIVKMANLNSLWAEAQAYTSQLAEINMNSQAIVQIPDFDNLEIKGKISFVNPEINPDTRINLIRVAITNKGNQLKPGMPAYVILKSPERKTLTLPIDAVIRDGKGASVWVQTRKNVFKTVMVQTGLESKDRIEISSGLSEGDVVVLSGAYLLQSEYVFKKGANPMAEHHH